MSFFTVVSDLSQDTIPPPFHPQTLYFSFSSRASNTHTPFFRAFPFFDIADNILNEHHPSLQGKPSESLSCLIPRTRLMPQLANLETPEDHHPIPPLKGIAERSQPASKTHPTGCRTGRGEWPTTASPSGRHVCRPDISLPGGVDAAKVTFDSGERIA